MRLWASQKKFLTPFPPDPFPDRVGRGYVDKVAAFRGSNWAGVTIRAKDIAVRGLDLAVPRRATAAQKVALDGLVKYGRDKGVVVRVLDIP